MTHTSNAPITQPRWRRRVAGLVLFCFGWSNLQVGVEHSYRVSLELRAAHAGPGIDPAGPLEFRPQIGVSGGGVPVIAITAPNQAGLSHNQHQRFDVDAGGVILNNSQIAGNSLIGGAVTANPNLQGRPALTILNEVTHSGAPGQLNGIIEVFGSPAAVIVANPNGIVCNGCGVLNTGRFTLTTGVPNWLDANANANASDFANAVQFAYDVTGGRIAVEGMGIEGTVGRLDLIGETLDIDAPLRAHYLDGSLSGITLAAGRQRFRPTDAGGVSSQPLVSTAIGNSPAGYAIDATALGAMRAGQIHILATEQGLGVNLAGPVAAFQQGIHLDSAGPVQLRQLAAAGEIELDSDGNLSIGQDINAGGAIHINSGGSVNLNGGASAGGDLNLHGADAIDVRGNLYSGGHVEVTTPSSLHLEGTLDAVDDIQLNSGALTLNAPLRGSGSLSIDTSADVSLAGAISVGGNASITSGGYLAIQAPIQAANDLTLVAESTRISADVTVGHDYNVNASESITLDGASHAGHGIRLSTDQLFLNSAIQAPLVNLDSDSLNLGQDGLSIDGNLNLDLRGDFTLNGPLSVNGNARIESGGSQHYLSEVQAEGSLALLAGGNLTLDSNVQAGTQMILEAGGDLHLHGAANANAGMRLAAGGQLQAEQAIVAGALDVSAADARFAEDVAAGGDMRIRVGKLQANGSLQSGGTLDIVAGGGGVEAGNVRSNLDLIIESQGSIHLGDADAARDLQLGAQADIDSGHLIAGRDLNLDTRGGTLQSGPIQAGGNVDIHAAGNINLNGGLFSAQGIALLGSGSLDVNGDTQAAHGITLRAEGIALNGTLHAGGNSLLDAGAGTLNIADSAYIAGDAQISGRSIELAGIQSQAAVQLHAGDGGYRNLGDSLVGGDYLARSGGTHSIAGTLVVVGNSDIEATGDILLGGRLEAGGDYHASSGGQLNHAGASLILGDAQLSSVGAQHLAGSIGSAGNLTLDAGNGLLIDASVHSNGAVNLAGGSGGILIGGDLASVSDVTLNADGNLEILGHARFSQGDLNSRQGAILLQGDTAANSLHLSAAQSIDLTGASVIDGNLVAQAGDIRFGQLDVGGDLSAHADANLRFLGDSRIAGQVDLSAGDAIDLQADMTLAQSLNIDTAGDFLNEGRLAVAGNLEIAARNIRSNLVADGGLIASGHLHAQANGNIALGQQGDFTAVDGIELAAVNLSHAGQMQSGGPLNFSGNSFSNSGLVAAESINLASQLSNSGTLYGGRIEVSDHSHNSGRMAAAQLDLGSLFNSGQISGESLRLGATANQGQIGGQNIAISGGLDNSGTLGASGQLQIDGGHVNNSGDLSGETVTIQAGTLSNGGRLRAAGNMQLTLADLNNSLAESRRCVADPDICAQLPDTRPLTDDDYRWSQTPGEIAAGGNLQISAASLTNQGIVRSGGNFTASLTGAFQNQRSHNDLYTDAQYGQPAPAASSGILEVGGNLTLNAASLDNSGALRAAGDITLESLGDFSNTTPLPGLVGRISGRQIRIDADTVLNQGELLASAGQVQITSQDDIANQGDAARIEAFTDARLVASNGIDNSANSNILANNLLHLAANRISNAGNLYGPAGPVARIEILAADRFANSGSAVAGSALDLNTNQYSNTGTVGSFGDATLTLPGIWSAAANPLIAKGNLWLDVQGIAVAAGESWVSDAAWVGWNGTLVNHGSVSLNTASGNIDNLASGSRRRVGAPPADGAFLLLDAPAWTDEAFNWQIDGYDDVDLRADVSIAQFNGSLTNLAADAAVGGNYVYTPNSLPQAVYWVGENAAGEVITHTGNGRSLPRLYAPGVSSIVLTGPDPGTLVADSLLLQGVDLVLPAALDTAAEADHIAQAQATQVTVQVAVAGSPVPLEADTPSPAADVAPDPLDLQPADAETPEASVGAGDTASVGASVPPDSHLAVPAPDLADPAAGVALLRAGEDTRVALAWDSRRSVPGSIAAGDLALFLSGNFSNRGELAVERDLILHAAAGIDNFGAAIQAGGYLELAGDTLDNRSGSIQAQQLAASFTGNLDNTDGLIRVSEWAQVFVGGDLINDSGLIEAGKLALSVKGDLYNRTVIASVVDTDTSTSTTTQQTDVYGNPYLSTQTVERSEHHETAGQRARIAATDGDLTLAVGGDLQMLGADLSASGNVFGQVAGNIEIGALELRQEQRSLETQANSELMSAWGESLSYLPVDASETRTTSSDLRTEYLASSLNAGGNLLLQAGGDANLIGTDLSAGGTMKLLAAGDLSLGSVVASTQMQHRVETGNADATPVEGVFSEYRLKVEDRTQELRVGGNLSAGGDFTAQAGGTLTLTAADIEAGGAARFTAPHIKSDVVVLHQRQEQSQESGLSGWFKTGNSEVHRHTESVGTQIKAAGNVQMLALESPNPGAAPAGATGSAADANATPARSGIDLTSISLSGKDILLASSGDIRITSAYDLRQDDQRNTQATQVESFASQITQASHLAGDNITMAGANLAVDAGDLVAAGKVRMLASGNLSLGANTDRVDDHSLSIQSKSSGLKKKMRLDEFHLQSATTRPTSLSGAAVELQAGGDMALYASQISASDQSVVLVAGGDLLAYAVQDQELRLERHERDNSFLGFTYHHRASEDRSQAMTAAVASLQSPDSLSTASGGDSLFQATRLHAPSVDLQVGVGENGAKDARLLLEGVIETLQVSHTEEQGSLLWQRMAGEGSTTQSLLQPNISGSLSISAPGGVVAKLPEGDFKSQLLEQAALPGQAWLADVALRDDAQWQQVALAFDHWEYEQEGLSGIAALIIAVVVAIATQGMGAELVANASGTTAVTTGSGAVAFTAVEAASVYFPTWTAVAQAGITSIATQATTSFINNKGDIGETLSDLGSRDSVRNIVSSMLTAGVTTTPLVDGKSLNQLAGLENLGSTSQAVFSGDSVVLGDFFTGVGGRALVKGGVDALLLDRDFGESVVNSVVADVSAVTAFEIGERWGGGVDPGMQTLAHAALGCASASLSGGECAAGAAGSASESLFGNLLDAVVEGPVIQGKLDQALYLASATLLGGIAGGSAGDGKDGVISGAQTALNAATNNYLSHSENKDRSDAARKCAEGDPSACARHDALDALDKQRDADLDVACYGQKSSPECYSATITMREHLSTFAASQVKSAIQAGQVNTDELTAHRNELQSYVPLLKVADLSLFDTTTNNQWPDRYDSDPYKVIDPNNNGLYIPVKFGDEWLTVGSTGTVFTKYGGLNGIQNPPSYAPGLLGSHVNDQNATVGIYTLYYTPTHGFWKDGLLTFADKMEFTTKDARNFSPVLSDVQESGHEITWVAHSRGGVTFTEAARITEGDLSYNSVVFHAGANNRRETNAILAERGINLANEGTDKPSYLDSEIDAVPNIIGLNGNPVQMLGSFVALPLLFAGPERSPHTLPTAKPTTPSTSVTAPSMGFFDFAQP